MDEGPVVCDIEIHNTDVESPKIVKPFTVVPHPVASETVNSDNDCYSRTAKLSLVRQLPISEGGRIINVFQSCIDDVCSCVHKIGDSPSQLRPCRIGNFLFSNQCFLPNEHVFAIWNGICDGFKIVDDVDIPSYECQNYNSILGEKFSGEMSSILNSDLAEGRIKYVNSKPHCVHSLGGVEKVDGRLRPITDCSMPEGISINNYMSTTCEKFSYNSVDDLAQMLSPNEYMSVTDISNAYRSVSIHPDHTKYQGIGWGEGDDKCYYEDQRLCFGLKCAPFKFNLLSNLVVDMLHAEGVCRVVNYLDDFAIIEHTLVESQVSQAKLIRILRRMGFSISWKKLESPSRCVKFLGILVDSVTMSLSLPMSKVEKLMSEINNLQSKGFAKKKDLECIGGLMAHCSTVVHGGRTFSRRLYDLCASTPRRGVVPLSDDILLDFAWWLSFCEVFNGTAKIVPRLKSVSIVSDSSFVGFGLWCDDDWAMGGWDIDPPSILSIHDHVLSPPNYLPVGASINTLELWPVLQGVRRHAPKNMNSTIEIITDNSQVMYMINTGRSSNKFCMSWLRELFWLCFVFNVRLFASYVRSEDNMLADALSRFDRQCKINQVCELIHGYNMCCSDVLRRTIDFPTQGEGRGLRIKRQCPDDHLGKENTD